MALNINQTGNLDNRQVNKAQGKVESNQQVQSNPTTVKASAGTAVQDSVSLTQQAQDLNKMQGKLSTGSSFHQERVESLKKAISEGKYSIDPEKLAQNMLNFEDELKDILG